MKKIFLTLFIFFGFISAKAEIKSEVVEYKHNGTILEGYMVYDDTKLKEKRPAILIVHEWNGLNDYAKNRAKQFAEKGYVTFALDIYGKGVRPSNPDDAGKEATKYRDNRKLMRDRAKAGYDFIKTKNFVDPKKLVAIGYCFGGTVALEMARAGLPLVGVASFHGGLSTPTPQDANNIKAKLLILHGALDPYTKNEVPGFLKEMDDAKVDYQFIIYSNTVHAFTNPQAGNDIKSGAAYNPVSERRSLRAFLNFLEEIAPL